MKKYKYIIIFVAILLLSGCNQLNQTTEKENTTIDQEYVSFLGESLEYEIGDEIPNWESQFDVSEEVSNHLIITNFNDDEYFFAKGEYPITFELTLDDELIYESFTVTVSNNFTDQEIINSIQEIVVAYNNSAYYSYDAQSNLSIERNNSMLNFVFNSRFESYFNEISMDNMYHYSLNGSAKYNEEQTKLVEEFYYYYEDGLVKMLSKQENSVFYEHTEIPLSELNEYINISETKDISNIVDGVEQVEYRMTPSEYIIEIPMSPTNFSTDMFIELDSFFQILGFNDFIQYESYQNTFKDHYDLIKVNIHTNHAMNTINSIEIIMDEFFETISSELITGYTADSIDNATIVLEDFSTQEIEFNLPISSYNYNDSLYKNYQFDGEVNDAYIDTQNNLIIYTLIDSHFLYIFNYDTLELNQLPFELIPDQITADDDNIYISLTQGHEYYPDEPNPGALGVVELETLLITDIFPLDFDPYDIVVDENGYAYITNGSIPTGTLNGINTRNGQIVSTVYQTYIFSQINYSHYTNRVYYVEIETSYNGIDIYDVENGHFLDQRGQDATFEKKNLTLSPDGQYLYAINGTVFKLDSNFNQDVSIDSQLGFGFNSIAFDTENNLRFFSKDDGIYTMDSDNQFNAVYEYNNHSFKMAYDEDLIINIADNIIEVIDTNVDTQIKEPSIMVTVNYGEDFNINETLVNNNYEDYTPVYISGSVDTEVLGLHEMKYQLQSNENTFILSVYVQVLDISPPEISLPEDTSFLLEINQPFSPPTCEVTDNYDQSPTCSIDSNTVDTSDFGFYSITYRAEDSKGNVTYKTYTFEVALNRLDYELTTTDFTGEISDAVYSEIENAVFYTRMDTHQVIRYDFDTNTESILTFEYTPEYLLLQDGILYVTIIHDEHSPYWYDDQHGEIAIIDANTFELQSLNWIDTDPYSIAVIDNYIYITSGSGQWTNFVSYNLDDFSTMNYISSIREKSIISYSKDLNYIFTIRNVSPQSLYIFEVLNGEFIEKFEAPYHGEHYYGDDLFIYEDKNYVFSSEGEAFYIEPPTDKNILEFAFSVDFDITAYLYDEINDLTFFGAPNGIIKLGIFDSENLNWNVDQEIKIDKPVDELYGDKSMLYIISFNEDGMSFIKAIPTN